MTNTDDPKHLKIMDKNNSIVAIYSSHPAAEVAVKELQQSGFDMKKLSLFLGKAYVAFHVLLIRRGLSRTYNLNSGNENETDKRLFRTTFKRNLTGWW